MYKQSIKDNAEYLMPFIEGIKFYGANDLDQGGGTMMVLNENGDILTCNHIAQHFRLKDDLEKQYSKIVQELKLAKNKDQRRQVERKYRLNKGTVVLSQILLPIDAPAGYSFEIISHEYLDLALIKLKGIKTMRSTYPIFSEKDPEQGQSICKLGYAFPEFDIFKYSIEDEKIVIKEDGNKNFPTFPIDGIVTRGIIDERGKVTMFEMSTPGLRGQSGGPIFGPDGVVYGIQSQTKHLDLNFDVNTIVARGAERKNVTYTPFINLGVGITSTAIIEFLDRNNVEYRKR